jgi:hypothetical protein
MHLGGGRWPEVSVRYTLTGLNPHGRASVTAFLDPSHYTDMIEEWRLAIGKALASGRGPSIAHR